MRLNLNDLKTYITKLLQIANPAELFRKHSQPQPVFTAYQYLPVIGRRVLMHIPVRSSRKYRTRSLPNK